MGYSCLAMNIAFDRYRKELEREGLQERSPYSFHYPDESMVFTPEPDPDGMIDLDFTTAQIGHFAPELADRIRTRIMNGEDLDPED